MLAVISDTMEDIDFESPLVTIAIPTFNRAETFLPSALDAACRQTYTNLDILVADNASTDRTRDVVTSYHNSKIRYHRHVSNIGSAANINYCIGHSIGEYTLLLMDDDEIDNDFIQCCIDAARGHRDVGLIRTGARILRHDGSVLGVPNNVAGLSFTEFVIAWTNGKTILFLCSTLFRTTLLRQTQMYSRHNLWNDVIAELQIASSFTRIDVPDIKASFRKHGGEITTSVGIDAWCEDSLELLERVAVLVPDDANVLRSHLRPFMATLNCEHALHLGQSWFGRLVAFCKVVRLFGLPPRLRTLMWEALGQLAWYRALRGVKRAVFNQAARRDWR